MFCGGQSLSSVKHFLAVIGLGLGPLFELLLYIVDGKKLPKHVFEVRPEVLKNCVLHVESVLADKVQKLKLARGRSFGLLFQSRSEWFIVVNTVNPSGEYGKYLFGRYA